MTWSIWEFHARLAQADRWVKRGQFPTHDPLMPIGLKALYLAGERRPK